MCMSVLREETIAPRGRAAAITRLMNRNPEAKEELHAPDKSSYVVRVHVAICRGWRYCHPRTSRSSWCVIAGVRPLVKNLERFRRSRSSRSR
jgi:hypothetical protein